MTEPLRETPLKITALQQDARKPTVPRAKKGCFAMNNSAGLLGERGPLRAPFGIGEVGDGFSRADLMFSEGPATTHPAAVHASSSEMYPTCSETAGESARGPFLASRVGECSSRVNRAAGRDATDAGSPVRRLGDEEEDPARVTR